MFKTDAAAIMQIKPGPSGASAKLAAYRQPSDTDWASLADNAMSRPPP